MAASRFQMCTLRGKSWRTSGILYLSTAAWTMGAAWAQAGHSRSSNSKMATLAPAGGFTMEVSRKVLAVLGGAEDWACAEELSGRAIRRAAARRVLDIRRQNCFFVFLWAGNSE